jgi:hypothetical protein
MSCNKLWNREVLLHVLPKSFVNGKYKDHRETILFEREKSLFPAMQAIISREKIVEKLERLHQSVLKKHPVDRVILARVKDALHTMRQAPLVHKKKIVRKCPVQDCKGFVSSKWKCGLCKSTVCKDCNEVGEHTCDPGAIETIKLLKKDTKPCPTCGEMIFKASGCSQMWCTSCHAVFDWNTMQLETGLIHNPHYYEFQRKNGTLQRHPGDVPCGNDELPRYGHLLVAVGGDPTGYIGRVHRLTNHLRAYLVRVRVADDMNYSNRKRFMKGEITEYQFKTRIQRSEKAREKIRDVCDVIRMFSDTLTESLIQVFQRVITLDEMETMVTNLGVYVNESLRKIKVLYDNCVMQFLDVGTMTMVYQ